MDKLTSQLIESKKYHDLNPKYADCFASYSVNSNILYDNPKTPFKVRIFDNFFTQSEFMYFKRITNSLVITNKQYSHDGWASKPINFNNLLLYAGFRKIDGSFIQYKICGYYVHETVIVLCTMPHAKTLMKSYENNKQSTLLKLMNFCLDPYEAIQEAKILVEKNG